MQDFIQCVFYPFLCHSKNKGAVKKDLFSVFLFFLLFFTVLAPVNFFFRVGENKYLVQFLFYGSDASGIFAFYDIDNLFWQMEFFLFHDVVIFYDINRDIVVNKS